MTEPNYYRILQVDIKAGREVIEKAYKTLAKQYHPDKVGPGAAKAAHERMRLLNEAYSVLSDPGKRKRYDLALKKRLWNIFLEDGLIGMYRELSGH